jgi:hypothetical protein
MLYFEEWKVLGASQPNVLYKEEIKLFWDVASYQISRQLAVVDSEGGIAKAQVKSAICCWAERLMV